MIVVDASAAVALVLGEPTQNVLAAKLSEVSDLERVMSPASYCEFVMALARTYPDPKLVADTFLRDTRVTIFPIDQQQSQLSVHAFLFFGKGRHPARLNLGDCFSYAAAKALNAPLLFVGNDFGQTDVQVA